MQGVCHCVKLDHRGGAMSVWVALPPHNTARPAYDFFTLRAIAQGCGKVMRHPAPQPMATCPLGTQAAHRAEAQRRPYVAKPGVQSGKLLGVLIIK